MCGLAGAYHFKKGDLHESYFAHCMDTMRRRGPDDRHLWQNEQNYIAAFTRLSIRDTSLQGRQPMFSASGKFCLSFNGELYNTEAFKKILLPYDIAYQSTSDTELFLYALIHLGLEKTLALADGIFAFAFYDVEKNALWLARDRMGVKPLYTGVCRDGIVYSSQYDHVIGHPFFSGNSYDEKTIASYLYLGYMPEGDGIIQHTSMLPHGHYMIVSKGKSSLHAYYDYPSSTNEEKENGLEKIISNSVQSQLVSDVPVGTFMSGGIDSTLVSYYANQQAALKSFTIGVDDPAFNETQAAKAYAEKFHLENFCKYIRPEQLESLIEDHVQAFSEPFADYSSLPTLLLSSFAREQVTVALSGDGGDELFWGYPRNAKALEHVYLYKNGVTSRRIKLIQAKISNSKSVELLRHWNMKNFTSYYYSTLSISGATKWLAEIMKAEPGIPFFLLPALQKQESANLSVQDYMQLVRKMEVDLHLQRILLKVDRASMYHSLEVRVPLLSNAMLEKSLQYNYDDCIKNKMGKMNLRQILMEKAGKDLVMQPKKGFTIPMDKWLRNDLKKEVTEKIMDMPSRLAVFFEREKIQRMLSLHAAGKQHGGWFIWALYALVRWDDTHHKNYTIN